MSKKNSIKKNRNDQEMFIGFEEELETIAELNPEPTKQRQISNENNLASFIPADLQDQIGKAFLDLKIKLFNEGIINFDTKVKTINHEIIITAIPKTI
jgi:hypothetical protein